MRIAYEKQQLSPKSGFDLGGLATYYTRPMPSPWSKPLEVDRLAGNEADVDFVIPLAELSGLRSLRDGVAGSVSGRVHFGREQGLVTAEIALSGTVTLECQRCMKPMQLPLETTARVALLASEADVGRVPADLEPVLTKGGRISIGELITEELLLVLPIVPLHTDSNECAAAPAMTARDSSSETQRPFAGLGELLKR
jgi:uncharacterized protein